MKRKMSEFTTRIDPVEWDALYVQNNAPGRELTFIRGVEHVHNAHSRLSLPGQYWVDVGCGTGRLTQKLAELGLQVVGLDADETVLRFAKDRIKGSSESRFIEFIDATAERLPLTGEKVDGVTAASLMGCLADPLQFIREIYRILRPGGHAIVTFSNRQSLLLRINTMLNRLRPQDTERKKRNERYHLYSQGEACRLFEEAGLKVIKTELYNFFLVFGSRIVPRCSVAFKKESSSGSDSARLLARNFLLIGKKP